MKTRNLLEGEEAAVETTDADAAEQRQKQIDDLAAKAREADVARAKAEGELEGTRKALESSRNVPAPIVTISDAQWAQAEAESGLTRQQITANAQLTQQIVNGSLAPLQKNLDDARREAREAKEELERIKSRGSASSVEQEFYEANAAFGAHKKEVREFVEMFPESDRNDPAKLKTILEKSKTYVRGAVGAKMRNSTKGNDGSARLSGGGFDGEEQEESDKIDFSGLDDVNQRRVIEDIHRSLQDKSSDKEREESIKRSSTSDGRGVRFSSEDEWKRGEKILRDGVRFGGQK